MEKQPPNNETTLEQAKARIAWLERVLQENRQTARTAAARCERLEKARDELKGQLQAERQVGRAAAARCERLEKARDELKGQLQAERQVSRAATARCERLEKARDEAVQKLREQTEKRRQSEKELMHMRQEARRAAARRDVLEKALQETRQSVDYMKCELAKQGKYILFGAVKPENDPQLEMQDAGEDSLLQRGVRSLRQNGTKESLRKLSQEFRKRK